MTKFDFQLNNNIFCLKIHLLNNIIKKLIDYIKSYEIISLTFEDGNQAMFESIFKLVCKPEKFDIEEIFSTQYDGERCCSIGMVPIWKRIF